MLAYRLSTYCQVGLTYCEGYASLQTVKVLPDGLPYSEGYASLQTVKLLRVCLTYGECSASLQTVWFDLL